MLNTTRARRRAAMIFWLSLLAATLSACGQVVAQLPAATTSPSAAPSATPPPSVAPTPTPSDAAEQPAPPDDLAAAAYFWPATLPDGMELRPELSSASTVSFTLELADPRDPQRTMTIAGGAGVVEPPAMGSQPATVREQPGLAFSTGAGWSLFWREGGHAYSVGGFASREELGALAAALEPLDLTAWRERLSLAAEATAGSAEPCPSAATAAAGSIQLLPSFCLVWRDTFADELGFRIELDYLTPGEQFSYEVAPDVTAFAVPEADRPSTTDRDICARRSSFSISVVALLPAGETIIDGMAMDTECMMGFAAASAASTGKPPLEQEQLRICVAGAHGPLKPEQFKRVAEALLNDVAQNPQFRQMNQQLFAGRTPTLDEGCPGPMTILAPEWSFAGGKGGAPYRVATPSPYFLFVWLADERETQRAFGASFPRRTGQELLCEGDACATINSAIYLTPADLADPARLTTSLLAGLGLQPQP